MASETRSNFMTPPKGPPPVVEPTPPHPGFPDAKDRTPNDPGLLLTSKEVKQLTHGLFSKQDVTPSVIFAWFQREMKRHGWSECVPVGAGILLFAEVKLDA